MSLTREHMGKHNDYPWHSKIKKESKRDASKKLRRILDRLLRKESKSEKY